MLRYSYRLAFLCNNAEAVVSCYSLKPETPMLNLKPKPQTADPKSQTLAPKPKPQTRTLNPKSQALHPKPQTLSPKQAP